MQRHLPEIRSLLEQGTNSLQPDEYFFTAQGPPAPAVPPAGPKSRLTRAKEFLTPNFLSKKNSSAEEMKPIQTKGVDGVVELPDLREDVGAMEAPGGGGAAVSSEDADVPPHGGPGEDEEVEATRNTVYRDPLTFTCPRGYKYLREVLKPERHFECVFDSLEEFSNRYAASKRNTPPLWEPQISLPSRVEAEHTKGCSFLTGHRIKMCWPLKTAASAGMAQQSDDGNESAADGLQLMACNVVPAKAQPAEKILAELAEQESTSLKDNWQEGQRTRRSSTPAMDPEDAKDVEGEDVDDVVVTGAPPPSQLVAES
ncbi:unnamed protein product [Amoebophrya sp. A120]|nr:unnamed protein product [Amoebophrya sp. A120]|eukprot:GSA120T00006442001.1